MYEVYFTYASTTPAVPNTTPFAVLDGRAPRFCDGNDRLSGDFQAHLSCSGGAPGGTGSAVEQD